MSQKPKAKSNQRKLRIALDCHNLSTMSDILVKTGIQQVVSHLLEASLNYENPEVEIVRLPWLPLYSEIGAFPDLKPTHVNNSKLVLEEIKDQLQSESHEAIWGDNPAELSEKQPDEAYYEALISCEWYIVTGLCEFRHAIHKAKKYNPALRVAVLVHDIIPLTHPALVAKGMPEWYFYSFLGSIRQYADLILCVSRPTAICFNQELGQFLSSRLPVIATVCFR